jgi:hypothetical protein
MLMSSDDASRVVGAHRSRERSMSNPLSRRAFLGAAALTGAVGASASSLFAQQATPALQAPRRGAGPVRVRGRVHAAGAGLPRVAVTDGLDVVLTDSDGRFTLVADGRQPFVYISLPDGVEIPRNETGTARFYRPLSAPASGEVAMEFELARRRSSAEHHRFVALADTQTENADDLALLHAETVPDVRGWGAEEQGVPAFGVAVGDIMWDRLELYPEYERAVRDMGIPFFQVVGNHDLEFKARSAELTVSTFMRHFGPPYYSFDMGAVHYVVLQDVLWHGTAYVGYIDERQLRWLEADLARVERGRPVVVFLHIPVLSLRWQRDGRDRPYPHTSVNNRAALYELLEPFQAHVLSGHTHENEHVFEGGLHEHVLGTTCGAWWTGPICQDGTPSGYAIYDVRGEELRWTYKATGQPRDHQVRLYAPGSDTTAPDEIVANVWNWDPKWQVEWVADGEPRGPMARRVGFDPMSLQMHSGPTRPAKRGWIEPAPTDHLFYAPVASGTREVQVRATDRFGRTFTAEWRRG